MNTNKYIKPSIKVISIEYGVNILESSQGNGNTLNNTSNTSTTYSVKCPKCGKKLWMEINTPGWYNVRCSNCNNVFKCQFGDSDLDFSSSESNNNNLHDNERDKYTVDCPNCGKELTVEINTPGLYNVRCDKCGRVFKCQFGDSNLDFTSNGSYNEDNYTDTDSEDDIDEYGNNGYNDNADNNIDNGEEDDDGISEEFIESVKSLGSSIKKIIDRKGKQVLLDQNVVNMLNDLHAYHDNPSAKYVLKTLINDGYVRKILSNPDLNEVDYERLVTQFVERTGFKEEVVYVVLVSIDYGLGRFDQDDLSLFGLSY